MKLLFDIGPFSIHYFGVMIALGVMAAWWIVNFEAKRRGLDADKVLNIGIGALIGGMVGARIFYIVFYNPAWYLANPSQIFAVHQGGLSIHGGIAGGLLVGWLLARNYKFSFWALADLFAPALIMAQAIGRIGCDVFGRPTTLPWGIMFQGQILHPVQMYEFLLNLGLFGWLWHRRKSERIQGNLFFQYIIGFLVIRGIIEFFRLNPQVFGFLSVSHLITILGLGLVLLAMKFVKRPSYSKVQEPTSVTPLLAKLMGLAAVGISIYYVVHLVL